MVVRIEPPARVMADMYIPPTNLLQSNTRQPAGLWRGPRPGTPSWPSRAAPLDTQRFQQEPDRLRVGDLPDPHPEGRDKGLCRRNSRAAVHRPPHPLGALIGVKHFRPVAASEALAASVLCGCARLDVVHGDPAAGREQSIADCRSTGGRRDHSASPRIPTRRCRFSANSRR